MKKFNCCEPWYSLIKTGQKTVEGRINKNLFAGFVAGEVIKIENANNKKDFVIVTIDEIINYSSFEEMIIGETLEKVLPIIDNIQDGVNVYRQFYSEEVEKEKGVLAIRIKNDLEDILDEIYEMSSNCFENNTEEFLSIYNSCSEEDKKRIRYYKYPDYEGKTLFMNACEYLYIELIELFLSEGVNMYEEDDYGENCMYYLMKCFNDINECEKSIKKNEDIYEISISHIGNISDEFIISKIKSLELTKDDRTIFSDFHNLVNIFEKYNFVVSDKIISEFIVKIKENGTFIEYINFPLILLVNYFNLTDRIIDILISNDNKKF